MERMEAITRYRGVGKGGRSISVLDTGFLAPRTHNGHAVLPANLNGGCGPLMGLPRKLIGQTIAQGIRYRLALTFRPRQRLDLRKRSTERFIRRGKRESKASDGQSLVTRNGCCCTP
jgi:hypothetical protein